MEKYIIQFEKLYTKIKAHDMTLPDGVLAYRILNSANLVIEDKKDVQSDTCRVKI